MIVLWISFNIFVLAMLALDLRVFHRNVHEVRIREALGWTAVWIRWSQDAGRLRVEDTHRDCSGGYRRHPARIRDRLPPSVGEESKVVGPIGPTGNGRRAVRVPLPIHI